MSSRGATALLFLAGLSTVAGACASCVYQGPRSPSEQKDWLARLVADKYKTLSAISFSGGVFDDIPWTQTSYIQPQMHPYDRYFYDPVQGNYTVSRYLADLTARYGGVDSILMWPTYTNIGIDDRNQFDYFRTMPGGLAGVAAATAELNSAGVKVLWPYNPWDTGTRREVDASGAPCSDADTFATLLKQTGGHGFNGDTMGFVPSDFWKAAVERAYPLAFEPEGGGNDESLNWATMGWGYYSYPAVPEVNRYKFLTSGKFMTNVCDRWAQSKTDNLQSAWFNGEGYESWENVWGTWNGITPRDGEAIRRVATMLRFFGSTGHLTSSEWEPHTSEALQACISPASPSLYPSCISHLASASLALQAGVYSSRWLAGGTRMWTLVNRAGRGLSGVQLAVPPVGAATSLLGNLARGGGDSRSRYYDCYSGAEIKASAVPPPPPPQKGFVEYLSLNCYGGHGGTEIDSDKTAPVGLTVEQCQARCDATPT
jgi:hypothetical protein